MNAQVRGDPLTNPTLTVVIMTHSSRHVQNETNFGGKTSTL